MSEPLAKILPGMTGRKEVVVTRELTVGAHVPGMPLVYGTPMMIFLMEVASGEAVGPHLPPGWATVGARSTSGILRRRLSDERSLRRRGFSRPRQEASCSPSRRMTANARSARERIGAARSI